MNSYYSGANYFNFPILILLGHDEFQESLGSGLYVLVHFSVYDILRCPM